MRVTVTIEVDVDTDALARANGLSTAQQMTDTLVGLRAAPWHRIIDSEYHAVHAVRAVIGQPTAQ